MTCDRRASWGFSMEVGVVFAVVALVCGESRGCGSGGMIVVDDVVGVCGV